MGASSAESRKQHNAQVVVLIKQKKRLEDHLGEVMGRDPEQLSDCLPILAKA
jgi:hypothetical protein